MMTAIEAAERFSIPAKRIRYLCLKGHIPYIVDRPRIVDEQDLIDYFEEKTKAALVITPGTPEHAEVESRKDRQEMRHRLRVKALRRKMKRLSPD